MTRAAAAALALLATGCATIVAGGPDHVPVSTNPPGAYVYVNGQVVGQTPMVVSLDRHDSAQIQIYLPGFQPIVLVRDKSLNAWTLLNILVGVLPIIVDLVTGDIQEYDDTPLALGLTPATPGTMPTPPPPPPPYPPAPAPAAPWQAAPPPAPPPTR